MLALLLITALFIALSIFFFFRTEKLQNKLRLLKRDSTSASKENISLSESIAVIAGSHEEFAKNRLQLLLADNENHPQADHIELIKPLITNYVTIFNECLKQKGRLHIITKKCFDSQSDDKYKEYINKIIKNDEKLQRLWSSNNLIGFISLVEALLVKYNIVEKSRTSIQNESA